MRLARIISFLSAFKFLSQCIRLRRKLDLLQMDCRCGFYIMQCKSENANSFASVFFPNEYKICRCSLIGDKCNRCNEFILSLALHIHTHVYIRFVAVKMFSFVNAVTSIYTTVTKNYCHFIFLWPQEIDKHVLCGATPMHEVCSQVFLQRQSIQRTKSNNEQHFNYTNVLFKMCVCLRWFFWRK